MDWRPGGAVGGALVLLAGLVSVPLAIPIRPAQAQEAEPQAAGPEAVVVAVPVAVDPDAAEAAPDLEAQPVATLDAGLAAQLAAPNAPAAGRAPVLVAADVPVLEAASPTLDEDLAQAVQATVVQSFQPAEQPAVPALPEPAPEQPGPPPGTPNPANTVADPPEATLRDEDRLAALAAPPNPNPGLNPDSGLGPVPASGTGPNAAPGAGGESRPEEAAGSEESDEPQALTGGGISVQAGWLGYGRFGVSWDSDAGTIGVTRGYGLGLSAPAATLSTTGVPPSSTVASSVEGGVGLGQLALHSKSSIKDSLGRTIEVTTYPSLPDGTYSLFSPNASSVITITDREGNVSTYTSYSRSQGKSPPRTSFRVDPYGEAFALYTEVFDRFSGQQIYDETFVEALRGAFGGLENIREVLDVLGIVDIPEDLDDDEALDAIVEAFITTNVYDMLERMAPEDVLNYLKEEGIIPEIPGPVPNPLRVEGWPELDPDQPPLPERNPHFAFGPPLPEMNPGYPDQPPLPEMNPGYPDVVPGHQELSLGPQQATPNDTDTQTSGPVEAGTGLVADLGDTTGAVTSDEQGLGPGGTSPADPSSPAGGAAAASGGHTGTSDNSGTSGTSGSTGGSSATDGGASSDSTGGSSSTGTSTGSTGGSSSAAGGSAGGGSSTGGSSTSSSPGGTSPADPSSPAGGAAAASGGHTGTSDNSSTSGTSGSTGGSSATDGGASSDSTGGSSSTGTSTGSTGGSSSAAGGSAAGSAAGDSSTGGSSTSNSPGGTSSADPGSPAGGAAAASGGHTGTSDNSSTGGTGNVGGAPGF